MKLRPEVLVSAQEGGEGTVFVVKDPTTGRFFRLHEPEYFVLQQLDGGASLEDIRRRAEERFGAELPPATLNQFITTLRALGLLAGEGAETGHLSRRPSTGQHLLYLRVKVFDPDRVLSRLVPWVGMFYTRAFVIASAALIALALWLTLAHGAEIARGLVGLARIETLVWVWFVLLLVGTVHEFAHCLTCKRFGGEVHDMGFLLLYFQPALYCNVSDAWLFPEKSKRLWVTFAGAYVELTLWALATVVWGITEPETGPHQAGLVVLATSGVKTVFNLNPLIKLDGYYLLSDWLEIPNLRARAFAYVKAQISRIRAGGSSQLELSPHRRVYILYGTLAAMYSSLLLGWLAVRLGDYLIGHYHGLGLILFTGAILGVFGGPLRRRRAEAAVAAPSRPRRRLRSLVWAASAAAAVLAALFLVRMELRVGGEFSVLPVHNADVRAGVEGIIEHVYVDEGATVQAGDLIALLSDRDYRSELRKIDAEINAKQATLRKLKAGPRKEEIALAERRLETAETRREQALRRLEEAARIQSEQRAKAEISVRKAQERFHFATQLVGMYRDLYKKNLVARLQLLEAEEAVAVREKEVEETQAELKRILADDLAEFRQSVNVAAKEVQTADGELRVLLAGSRPEEIEATEAEVARLAAQRVHLVDQVQRVRVVSPSAGIITTPKPREKIGQYLVRGDLIVKVHDLTTALAEIAIPEQEIADVKVGQPVLLRARAYPEMTFAGRVTSIGSTAIRPADERGRRLVVVTTEITNTSRLLKPEMTGHAKVACGPRRLVDLVTWRIARYVRVEFWSWW